MLDLEVITPERVLVKEQVEMVEAKGAYGEFGILPGHRPFLTTLEVGEVRFMKDGTTTCLASSGGFAEVINDKVTILLDTAEFAEDIDVDRAKHAMEKAESALKSLTFDQNEYRLYELALLRAITRIGVASKKNL